jgi:hypothetical protein
MAVADLQNAGYLDFLLRRSETRRPLNMLANVFDEVQDYRIQSVAWRDFEKAAVFLAKIGREATIMSNDVDYPALKRLLSKVAQMIELERRRVRARTNASYLGAWERLWPGHPRRQGIQRRIDLDARLQIQAAKMFRTFLHRDEGVSLRTIARLVVLTYIICGLAMESQEDGLLRIVGLGPNRTISVRSVEEKLRRGRIRGTAF